MRMWHYKLLKELPNKYITNQWRECNAIAAIIKIGKLEKNPIVKRLGEYSLDQFFYYCFLVEIEMYQRGFKHEGKALKELGYNTVIINNSLQLVGSKIPTEIYPNWMNDRYLKQCVYMLEEKYDCGMIPKEHMDTISRTLEE